MSDDDRVLSGLEAIAPELLAKVLAFTGKKSSEFSTLTRVSRSLAGAVGADGATGNGVWRALCQAHWRISDSRFAQWPRIASWRVLYRVLETWVPREGYYQLLDAAPWGMLLLLRFDGGDFVGHTVFPATGGALFHNPAHASYETKSFFRIRFSEDGQAEMSFENGAGVEVRAPGAAPDPDAAASVEAAAAAAAARPDAAASVEAAAAAAAARRVFAFARTGRLAPLGPSDVHLQWPESGIPPVYGWEGYRRDAGRVPEAAQPRALRLWPSVAVGSAAGVVDAATDATAADDDGNDSSTRALQIQRTLREIEHAFAADSLAAGAGAMLGALCDRAAVASSSLTLEWVDGPSRLPSFDYREGMPVIRPGLYHGAYEPMYGKYMRECILVEYRKYELGGADADGDADAEQWAHVRADVLRFPHQSDPHGFWDRVQSAARLSGVKELVFVVGRKVTGDMHVPLGEVTWVALVHPALATEGKKEAHGGAGLTDAITDRGNPDGNERVIRSWNGVGTLALPGFRGASWAPGRLLQLEPDTEGQDRFGFEWGGREGATVLRWLEAQSSFEWLL